ncbi:uncharacterized protein [Diabrotica undecimpunctata]|uniref:uncharacterized protein n=1 Tax=Diabrotica undecimpunctata TaxID=50387 RepID=UPI003B63CA08
MKRLYNIAKERDKSSKDLTRVRQNKNADGRVLRTDVKIKQRWYEYFSKLLDEKNQRRECRIINENVRLKVWKALGEERVVFFVVNDEQDIYKEEKMPNAWRESVMVSLYKDKGDVRDCKNYRGKKFMSHTMKIRNRTVEQSLRRETSMGEEQFKFMPGRRTTAALFALRELIEKIHQEEKRATPQFQDKIYGDV